MLAGRPPNTCDPPIPQATGKANVHNRFHYRGQFSGWWAIDDAVLGDRTCTPIP